jgi:Flp pilus assembly protein TadG
MSRRNPSRHWLTRFSRRRNEHGYVLAFSALLLIPILVIAGFAVDLGGNYVQISRVQRAADAGALAGVIWLPDFAKAQSIALDVVKRNGFAPGSPTGTTITVSTVNTRRLKVSITTPANRYLASQLLNINQTITRAGTGEFLRPIPMGSPLASLANDPESAAAPPQIWLNQSGRGSTKNNGDRYSSGVCGASGSGYASGCTVAPTNNDLSADGYYYVTQVDSIGTGPLRFQAFDPAFVYTGDNCTVNTPTAGQQTTLQTKFAAAPYSDSKVAERYSWSMKDYCPGDQLINGKSDLVTTYIVRAPDDTAMDLNDNPAICAISFNPYTGSIYNRLIDGAGNVITANTGGLENMPFYKFFRQWVDICTVNSPTIGDYVIQVTTTAGQSDPHFSTTASLTPGTGGAGSLETRDNSIVTGGHNRLALRSGWGSSMNGTGVSLFAGGRLPLYVNQNSTVATFYLARIEPQYAGQTLALTFFDVADTAGTAEMQVIPPTEYGSIFNTANCKFTRDGATPNSVANTNCKVAGLTSASYDARNVDLQLNLPVDYTCNEASPGGCWLKVILTFTGAPADTTTWTAALQGDPVRLVE